MKKTITILTVAAAFTASAPYTMYISNANAEEAVATQHDGKHKFMKGKRHHKLPESRSEAIKMIKERLSKLEAMSDSEWEAMIEKRKEKHVLRKERREKFKSLSSEERAELKKKFQEKRSTN